MSGAVAVAIIDGLTGIAINAIRSAAAIRKAADNGGEFTPEQRAETDAKLTAARSEMDAIGLEQGWLDPQD